ncbi:hypothetical protein KIPB_016965, partial [Kipferlia bialata]
FHIAPWIRVSLYTCIMVSIALVTAVLVTRYSSTAWVWTYAPGLLLTSCVVCYLIWRWGS